VNLKLFLAITFAVHFLAFSFIYKKKRENRYIMLCGTFAFLTAIYVLKWQMASIQLGPLPLILLLRVLAIGCTASYVYLSWPKIVNFFKKRSQAGSDNAAG
jgi:hypothetical protein